MQGGQQQPVKYDLDIMTLIRESLEAIKDMPTGTYDDDIARAVQFFKEVEQRIRPKGRHHG